MIEPWFSTETAPYFSLLSLLALLSCLQGLAAAGRAKRLVLGSYLGATALAALLAIVGLVALMLGQPQHVWITLMFSGALTFGLLVYYDWKIVATYREAELNKSVAGDL